MEVAAIAGDKLTRRITPISALSQKPKSETIPVMSAVPPEADIPAAKKDCATGVARSQQSIT